jgi:hypothetical protein
MSNNEYTFDAVARAFMTLPLADVERAQARLATDDPEDLMILKVLFDMCRQEHPRIKIVGVDAEGLIQFQRIHSVQDAPRGRA